MTAEPVLCWTVPGAPVPKARARVFFDHRMHKYRAITLPRVVAAELRIGQYLKVAAPHHKLLTGRLRVVLRFFVAGVGRADADNLQKLVFDALNNRAWQDDRQVAEATVSVYRFCAQPRTEIEVYTLDDDASTGVQAGQLPCPPHTAAQLSPAGQRLRPADNQKPRRKP